MSDQTLLRNPSHWFVDVSWAAGWVGFVITFLAVYIAAIGSVGWVIGIALGWIPAMLAAGFAFFVFLWLWWLILIAIAVLALKITMG
jgi:hypothetical protein